MTNDRTSSALPILLYLSSGPANHLAMQAGFEGRFRVLASLGMKSAWSHLEQGDVHVVIADKCMAPVNGIDALQRIRKRYPHIPRVLITAFSSRRVLLDAINRAGICHYIEKPWEAASVCQALEEIIADHAERYALASQNSQLLETNRQLEFALRQALIS